MYAPQFIVTSLGPITRSSRNDFTGTLRADEMWRVGMVHGYFKGETIDLYFPTEDEARRFGQWKIYEPSEIMDLSGGVQNPFTVKSIRRTKGYGKINEYTDKPEITEAWKTLLVSDMDDREVEFGYPTEREARERFDESQSYTMLDMLGTMVSVPAIVVASYQYAAEQAVERAKAKEQAEHELHLAWAKQSKEIAAQTAALEQSAWGSVQKEAADIGAAESAYAAAYYSYNQMPQGTYEEVTAKIAAYHRLIALGEQVEGQKAEFRQAQINYQVAKAQAAQAAQAARDAALSVQRRTIPSGIQAYTITNGGAAGYYNGVFYRAGTFHANESPYQWYGSYESKV